MICENWARWNWIINRSGNWSSIPAPLLYMRRHSFPDTLRIRVLNIYSIDALLRNPARQVPVHWPRDMWVQRVLNDLQRTRRSCGHMILSPSPPLPSASCFSFSVSCVSSIELTNGKEGERGWGRSQIIQLRESMLLYGSFNTLCVDVASQYQSTLHFI
jgi:hypothetical protein